MKKILVIIFCFLNGNICFAQLEDYFNNLKEYDIDNTFHNEYKAKQRVELYNIITHHNTDLYEEYLKLLKDTDRTKDYSKPNSFIFDIIVVNAWKKININQKFQQVIDKFVFLYRHAWRLIDLQHYPPLPDAPKTVGDGELTYFGRYGFLNQNAYWYVRADGSVICHSFSVSLGVYFERNTVNILNTKQILVNSILSFGLADEEELKRRRMVREYSFKFTYSVDEKGTKERENEDFIVKQVKYIDSYKLREEYEKKERIRLEAERREQEKRRLEEEEKMRIFLQERETRVYDLKELLGISYRNVEYDLKDVIMKYYIESDKEIGMFNVTLSCDMKGKYTFSSDNQTNEISFKNIKVNIPKINDYFVNAKTTFSFDIEAKNHTLKVLKNNKKLKYKKESRAFEQNSRNNVEKLLSNREPSVYTISYREIKENGTLKHQQAKVITQRRTIGRQIKNTLLWVIVGTGIYYGIKLLGEQQ